jgi:uracil-DNA glycosylase
MTIPHSLGFELKSYLGFLSDHDLEEVYELQPINRRQSENISRFSAPSAKMAIASGFAPKVSANVNALRPEIIANFDLNSAIAKSRDILAQTQTLDQVFDTLADFADCPLRFEGGKSLVRGRGAAHPEVLIIGEAPQKDEDDLGLAFQGAQGRLLARILAQAGLQDKTYMTQALFWRPAGDRPVRDEDMALSHPFLSAIVRHLKPAALLLLGPVAIKTMTGHSEGVARLRQEALSVEIEGQTIHAQASYAPSFLLRQPSAKALVWHDILRLVSDMK